MPNVVHRDGMCSQLTKGMKLFWFTGLRSSDNKKARRRGNPLHTHEPVTVASFRTWRGWRDCVARDPAP